MAVRYRTLKASPIESFAEGTPTTTWTTADDIPQQNLLTYLCSDGYNSGGMACASCESQCAFGKRYLKLGLKAEPEKARNEKRGVRVYKNGVLVGVFESQFDAERGMGFVSRGCVSKALKYGRPFLGFTFERV